MWLDGHCVIRVCENFLTFNYENVQSFELSKNQLFFYTQHIKKIVSYLYFQQHKGYCFSKY